jgi:hypothetical protein
VCPTTLVGRVSDVHIQANVLFVQRGIPSGCPAYRVPSSHPWSARHSEIDHGFVVGCRYRSRACLLTYTATNNNNNNNNDYCTTSYTVNAFVPYDPLRSKLFTPDRSFTRTFTVTVSSYSTFRAPNFLFVLVILPRSMSNSTLHEISPNAEIVSRQQALQVNVAAAVGLSNVLKSNLGPTGTLKLLVGGTIEQLKLTKDGLTLLKEMQIQHPTAALIARTATAQDDVTGDGTTSVVLLTGELLRQAELLVREGLHPRVLTDGLDTARDACLEVLKAFAVAHPDLIHNRDLLQQIARTSLATKLDGPLVDQVRALLLLW